ncbi:MAG: hypothetical protein ACRCU5_10165 [Rhizobiaceae bacterium]
MRKLFVAMMLAGVAGGFGYPWYIENRSGAPIGTFRVYDRATGFKPVDVILTPDQEPVRAFVDIVPLKGYYPDPSRTLLTLTVSNGGRTLLATKLNYMGASEQTKNLQNSEQLFRDTAGEINEISAGPHRFVVAEGDSDDLSLKTADLILRANVLDADPRVQPVGIALFVLGLLGFIRSRRRRNKEPEQAPVQAPPEKPKWGRDASDK